MNIHPVHHAKNDKNQFCGPSAISILTGMSTGEAARLLRHITGKPAIMGTSTSSIRRALEMCGLRWIAHGVDKERRETRQATKGYVMEGPTLAAWLAETVKMRSSGRVFLLVARNHWQVITGRRYCCGQVGEIISIADKRCRKRARVSEVYELVMPGAITIPTAARKLVAKVSTQEDKSRAEFKALCRAYRLTYIRTGDDYIEIGESEEFPAGLTFLFEGWGDAVDMVYRGLRHPEEIDEDGYLAH